MFFFAPCDIYNWEEDDIAVAYSVKVGEGGPDVAVALETGSRRGEASYAALFKLAPCIARFSAILDAVEMRRIMSFRFAECSGCKSSMNPAGLASIFW